MPKRLQHSERWSKPYPTTGKILFLYPAFQTAPGDDTVAHHTIQSAIWSKHSLIENTDCVHYGVDVKYYIEEKVGYLVDPVLEANGVTEDEVLWFDGSRYDESYPEGKVRFSLSKTCAAFVDERFRDYEWVVIFDNDIFFVVNTPNTCIPFFDVLSKREKIMGWGTDNGINNFDKHQIYRLGEKIAGHNESFEDCKAALIERISKYIGHEETIKWLDGGEYTVISGGIILFPSKVFWNEEDEKRRLLDDMILTLLDDEMLAYLWIKMGFDWFSLDDHLDCPHLIKHNEGYVDPNEPCKPSTNDCILHLCQPFTSKERLDEDAWRASINYDF